MGPLEPLETILGVNVILARATLRRNRALKDIGVEVDGRLLFRRDDVARVLGSIPLPRQPTEPESTRVRRDELAAAWQSLPSATKKPSAVRSANRGGDWSSLPQVAAVPVPKNLHALVRRTAELLSTSTSGNHGLRHTDVKSPLDVEVSRPLIPRAICLLDSFVRRAEARGLVFGSDTERCTVRACGERFKMRLRERLRQSRHRPMRDDGSYVPAYDYAPSGRLALTFEILGGYRSDVNIEDRGRRKLEDKLDEVLEALAKAAEKIRDTRALEEQRVRDAELARRHAEDRARQQWEEEQRRHLLLRQADDWSRAQALRQFIAAARAHAELKGQLSEAAPWLEWAVSVADALDPLANRR